MELGVVAINFVHRVEHGALFGALPHDGGGLGGGDASRGTGRDMKKHPVDGAGARVHRLRQDMTEAERQVWQMLRSHQMNGYKFRRQVPIGRYIADFVCHEARLIVEIDGGQHDRSSPREAKRSGFLQNEGYRILRFWNNEVLANRDGVHETIADELGRITPTQTLPHQGGGL
jgi:very-short-patch-repair endonuclease